MTAPLPILDGKCHNIAAVRSAGVLSIYVDGVAMPGTTSGPGASPLNVDNGLPLTIGCTQQVQEPHNQFIGALMNVSLWRVALSGDLLTSAAFNRTTPGTPGMLGYWSLDGATTDGSPNGNPAVVVGPLTYEYCFHCMWTQGANAYSFCQIGNTPGGSTPGTTVTVEREFVVAAGAPALGFSIMANQDTPAFPTGAVVRLTDPSGKIYNQDQNTASVLAHTSGGQLWTFMAINPSPGRWAVAVTAPASTGFQLSLQTVPSSSVVNTSKKALTPLYAAGTSHGQPSSVLDVVGKIAVGVVVGVAITAGIIVTGGAAAPAALAGLVAFTSVEIGIANSTLSEIDRTSLQKASRQIGGMAGFVVATDKMLVFDANVDDDPATQRIYGQRRRKLYPQIALSAFNKVQTTLVGDQVRRSNISTNLSSFASGYVTGAGHGLPFYLTGWSTAGPRSPLEEIISVSGPARFAAAEVQGRIFHFFACNCGYAGTTKSGLGRSMVEAGAVAFFGYNVEFIIAVSETPAFCAGDIAIDLAMIAGKSCDEAYLSAIAVFNSNISLLRANGDMTNAALLQRNRDALVAPSVDTMYGRKDARLQG